MERYELPEGWEWRRLSNPEVCILNPKKSELKNIADSTEVTFVPMSAVDEVSGTIANPEIKKLAEVRAGYTYFAEGDLIFAKITPCMENGKSAIARDLNNGIGFGSTEFHVFRPQALLIPEWLHILLRSKNIRDAAKISMCGAAGQQRVPIDFFKELEIPVPPISEQHRIVKRIKELTKRVEESHKIIAANLRDIDRLLPSAMDACFQGGDGWIEKPLRELCVLKTGKTPPTSHPEYFNGDIPFVCPVDIGERLLISEAQRRLSLKAIEDRKATVFEKGTVLLVCIGSTVGKVGLSARRLCSNQQITGLFFSEGILPDYAAWFLTKQRETIRNAAAGGGVPIINQNGVGQLSMRFPENKTEQSRIVEYLTSLQTKVEELKYLQAETETELEAFTPALLSKAFRGEL